MDPCKLFRKNILSTDGTLQYYEQISLQNIVLTNIVKNVWMTEKYQFKEAYHSKTGFNEIETWEGCKNSIPTINLWMNEKDQVKKHNCWKKAYDKNETWRVIEGIVLSKLRQLFLPRVIICRLVNLTEYVGNQIIRWLDFHVSTIFEAGKGVGCKNNKCDITEIFIQNMHHIKWKNNGRIDEEKTAIILLKEIDFEEEQKYVISCIYCLNDELKNVSYGVIKKYFRGFVNDIIDTDDFPMVYYWTNHLLLNNRPWNQLNLTETDDMSVKEYVLHEISNRYIEYYDIAIKYLWNKLTHIEKSEKFQIFLDTRVMSAFKYSLMSELSYEQQEKIFQSKFAEDFLVAMLCDWNFIDCFLPTVSHIFDILSPGQYVSLLERLYLILKDCLEEEDKFCKVDCYKSIFRTLWENTPICFKEYIFQDDYKSVKELIQLLGCDMY